MSDDELLDASEVNFIRRTIISAGKDPGDAATFAVYREAYLRVARSMRLTDLPPAGKSS